MLRTDKLHSKINILSFLRSDARKKRPLKGSKHTDNLYVVRKKAAKGLKHHNDHIHLNFHDQTVQIICLFGVVGGFVCYAGGMPGIGTS